VYNLVTLLYTETDAIKNLLDDDYEPFAVSLSPRGDRIWFKKHIPTPLAQLLVKKESNPKRTTRKRKTTTKED
jgi:hypothetical protein